MLDNGPKERVESRNDLKAGTLPAISQASDLHEISELFLLALKGEEIFLELSIDDVCVAISKLEPLVGSELQIFSLVSLKFHFKSFTHCLVCSNLV